MSLDGRTVMVAGVGPGLGAAVAERAAAEGARVVLLARSDRYTSELAASIRSDGGDAIAVCGDLTRSADCAAVVATAVAQYGRLDGVVYNAFMAGAEAPFEDADLDEWRRVMDVNVFGALEITRAALATLREQQGSVVLINSRQIRRLGQPRGGYAMSKAALFMAGRVLAHELGPSGVRVNTVVSGWMDGPPVQQYFEERARGTGVSIDAQRAEVEAVFALRRMPEPRDVADAVVFLLSDRARSITGQSLDVNSGESFH